MTENTEHIYTADPYSEATDDAYTVSVTVNGSELKNYGRIRNTLDYAVGANLHDVARGIARHMAANLGADEVTVRVESETDGTCQGVGTAYGWERPQWCWS